MTNDEMKEKLTQDLEFWNDILIKEEKASRQYTTFQARVIGKMEGMINISFKFGIISEAEHSELKYIYFPEENN